MGNESGLSSLKKKANSCNPIYAFKQVTVFVNVVEFLFSEREKRFH